ncbi:2-hydroxychromene-2-carboxylate isomerase [Sphingomonas sp. SRS2]|uniref:2-hydroxychromene-2-carboxylate isomerase n=1 Tax=Sphingomonas sp. SRS2 TaxID=133190 RepID=UPI0006184790|nr:2-hydroxychromene-2-carboxylate isomerase [Sphingomonas sp. SRS2]KKC26024.1 hypothetical protein WP12_10385 [Sphingomonas sp. SRS2]
MPVLDFYFDFISPFGYLARHRLERLGARFPAAEIRYHPVDLPRLKLAAGNNGPTNRQIPTKIRYLTTDLARWAERYGISIVAALPGADTAGVNKGLFFAADRNASHRYVREVWHGIWGEGRDPGDEAFLHDMAARLQWSQAEFVAFVGGGEAAERYEASNVDAVAKGVFGVPTIIADGKMWWGNDRIDFLEEYLEAAA